MSTAFDVHLAPSRVPCDDRAAMRERHDARGKDLLVGGAARRSSRGRWSAGGTVGLRRSGSTCSSAARRAHHAARLQRGLLGGAGGTRGDRPPRALPQHAAVPAVRGHASGALGPAPRASTGGQRDDPPKSTPMPRAIVIDVRRPDAHRPRRWRCSRAAQRRASAGVFHPRRAGLWVVVAAGTLPETPERSPAGYRSRRDLPACRRSHPRRLPPDAWEHWAPGRSGPQWRSYIAQQPTRTEEDEEFMNAVRAAAYEQDQARARDEGLSQGPPSQGLSQACAGFLNQSRTSSSAASAAPSPTASARRSPSASAPSAPSASATSCSTSPRRPRCLATRRLWPTPTRA